LDVNIRPRNAKPLSTFRPAARHQEMTQIADEIATIVNDYAPPAPCPFLEPPAPTRGLRVLVSLVERAAVLGPDPAAPEEYQVLNWPASRLFPDNPDATIHVLTPGDVVLGVLGPAGPTSGPSPDQFDSYSHSGVLCIVGTGEQITVSRSGGGDVPVIVAETMDGPELIWLTGSEIDNWLQESLSERAAELPVARIDKLNKWLALNGRPTLPYSGEHIGRLFQHAKYPDPRKAPPVEGSDGAGQQTIDAYVPFSGDAANESEDVLDRGPLALFLGRRLHLIWCELNGCPPHSKASAENEVGSATKEDGGTSFKQSKNTRNFYRSY
jgi:hypothetical protein